MRYFRVSRQICTALGACSASAPARTGVRAETLLQEQGEKVALPDQAPAPVPRLVGTARVRPNVCVRLVSEHDVPVRTGRGDADHPTVLVTKLVALRDRKLVHVLDETPHGLSG